MGATRGKRASNIAGNTRVQQHRKPKYAKISMRPLLARAPVRCFGRRLCGAGSALSWSEARFGGATLTLGDAPIACMDTFKSEFAGVMADIRANHRRGVFMRVPIERSAVISTAAEHGFKFHHAEGDSAMLLNWLPEQEPSPVPDFATHVIGLGGMCVNDKLEVLCVKEARAPAATSQGAWKLPGGLIELGEEIADGVAREVREETGVKATFLSVLAARHQHGAAFGRDDMYCICLMRPETHEIVIQEGEIGEAAWLPLTEYYESTKATSARQGVDENFNSYVVRHVLAACERGEDLSSLGFAGRKMPSPKGYVKGVTGLTSKPEFWMFSGFKD